jgi:outer membrane protein assembly factor BamB
LLSVFLAGLLNPGLFAQDTDRMNPGNVDDILTEPSLKWVFKTHAPLFGSPVVSDSIVYIGGCDSTFYALNISDGQQIWSFKTQGEIRSNGCVDNGLVYLNGGDGYLYALDRTNGRKVWECWIGKEKKYDFADYFQSTPIIENGRVYIGSGEGIFNAIDKQTGKVIWTCKVGDAIHNKPAINDGRIFFGSFDGFVYALNLNDGSIAWKFNTVGHRFFPKGEVQGSPVCFKNLVIVGARDYNIYALDLEKGYCHWNKAFTEGWCLNNEVVDSVLYTGSADERILMATNPANGVVRWKVGMEFLVFGNNGYSRNLLYVGTTNGKLLAFKRLTGEKVWSYKTESYLKNHLKYFKSDDTYRDDIYSIIKSNEQFLDVEIELGGVFSTPVVSGQSILFSSTNGCLYCLK